MEIVENAKHYLLSVDCKTGSTYLTKLGNVNLVSDHSMYGIGFSPLYKLEAEMLGTHRIELNTYEITDDDIQKVLDQI